jgi:hypothetical protein
MFESFEVMLNSFNESFLNSKDYFFCINYYFLSYLIALFILCYLFNYLYFTAKKLYFHLYLSFPI